MAMMKRSLACLLAFVLLTGIMVPAYAEGTPEPAGTADELQSEADEVGDESGEGQDLPGEPGPSNEPGPADDENANGGDDDADTNDDTGDGSDTGDTGDGSDTGDTGDGSDTGDTGDGSDTGDTGDGNDTGDTGDTGSGQTGMEQDGLPSNGMLGSGLQENANDGGMAEQRLLPDPNNGWKSSNGEKFYLSNGKRTTGWKTLDGKTYYLKTGNAPEWCAQKNVGAMVTGWLWKGGSNWYYFGSDGAMVTGWFKIGNEWYYSGSNGRNYRGWQSIDGKTYYFRGSGQEWNAMKNDGAMVTGWLWKPDGWYYFEPITDKNDKNYGKAPMVKNDWFKIGSEWYFSGSNGKNYRGWQTINGKTYYFRGSGGQEWNAMKNDGAMVTGWLWKPDGWYYFDPDKAVDNGKTPLVKNDWFKIGSEWYFSGSNGKNYRGWQTINGKTYYFRGSGGQEWNAMKNDGAMVTGWLWKPDGWYYFDPAKAVDNGKTPLVKNDWFTIGSEKYYSGSNGKNYRGWQTIGGKTYYFRNGGNIWCEQVNDGAMVTGLLWAGSAWYYFNQNGQKMTGWQTLPNGHTYYFDGSGVMAHGLRNISGKWYYFNNDGWLLTGSVTLGVKTYSTDSSGALSGFQGSQQTVNILNQIGWNLRAAYTWAASLRYANRSYRAGSVDAYANYGFSNGYGNCYVMNACLYKLAQTLGYSVKFINGGVRQIYGNDLPHGWCEIYDGGWYVFDSNFHNETGRNGYRISYGQSGTWNYVAYNEMY